MVDPADLRDVFDRAASLPPQERATFLARACEGSDELRREVERLLAADARLGSTFDTEPGSDPSTGSVAACTMSLQPGTRLGPYEIVAALGAGGMGEVYKARDTRLHRTVAIKVLSRGLTADSAARQRFDREARAVAALSHPHICPLFDVGHQDGIDFLVMEFLDGETLAARLAREKLALVEALRYATEIVEALAAAHEAGILHRDLKPGNIMLTRGGARLLDFGLAKQRQPPIVTDATATSADPITRSGTILGTVQYMAPEQLEGREADERTDIFAFGAVLYEMLTGDRAFEGASDAVVAGNILHADPRPLTVIDPGTPPALEQLVQQCLTKDPDARIQSASEVRAALTALRGHASSVPGGNVTRSRRAGGIAATAIAVLVASLALTLWTRSAPRRLSPTTQLVAVLPFRNLSPDGSQRYFAEGMTEEIRGQLSKMAGLRLLSAAAVEKYGSAGVSQMVTDLGVTSLVEGSVRRERDQLRVNVGLVDAHTQQTTWSEQYDRILADVFQLQSDVALRIAAALKTTLSPEERDRIQKRPTAVLDAYELYLRAKTQLGSPESMELLKKALVLDPRFAEAKAWLAYAVVLRGRSEGRQVLDGAITMAREAVALDPTMAASHAVLGTAYSMKGQDAESRLSFLRALELDPSDTTAMANLSLHESNFGRLDEALYWARRMFPLTARDGNAFYHVGVPLISLRDDDTTHRWLAEAERRFPDYPRIQVERAALEFLRGRGPVALAHIRAAVAKAPSNEELGYMYADLAWVTPNADNERVSTEFFRNSPEAAPGNWWLGLSSRTRYAYVLQRQGDEVGARSMASQAEKVARRELEGAALSTQFIELAATRLLQGDRPGTLDGLTRAYEKGARDYGFVNADPLFSPLRSEPAFRDIIERMKADVAAQRQRAADRGLLDLGPLMTLPK